MFLPKKGQEGDQGNLHTSHEIKIIVTICCLPYCVGSFYINIYMSSLKYVLLLA